MTGYPRHVSGRTWEDTAAAFLADRGMAIVARGYRCRLGELDLVCSEGDMLVIVEVRARARGARGSALETIGARKQRRIVNATRHFLMRNPQWHERPMRFDVIAVDGIDSSEPRLRWVKSAFDAS